MTDKEPLMIEGVDVSQCEYLTYQLEEDGQYYWFCKISPTGGPDECEYNPECFYKKVLKQLARKTQECEIWKNQVLILDEEDVTVQVTQEQFEEYKHLKQECEELKNTLTFSRKCARYNADVITSQQKDIDRYRKALEEIEEYVKSQFDGFGSDVYAMNKVAINKILNIINKAKGRNNE